MKQKELKRREKQKRLEQKKRRYLKELANREREYLDSIKAQEAVSPTFHKDAFCRSWDTTQNVEDTPVFDKRIDKPKTIGFNRSVWKVNDE